LVQGIGLCRLIDEDWAIGAVKDAGCFAVVGVYCDPFAGVSASLRSQTPGHLDGCQLGADVRSLDIALIFKKGLIGCTAKAHGLHVHALYLGGLSAGDMGSGNDVDDDYKAYLPFSKLLNSKVRRKRVFTSSK